MSFLLRTITPGFLVFALTQPLVGLGVREACMRGFYKIVSVGFGAKFRSHLNDGQDEAFDLWRYLDKSRTPVTYLLIHGLMESPKAMRELGSVFQKFGNTHALMLDGHHKLSPDHDYSLENWLDDVTRGIHYARENMGDRVVVVGYSLGSTIAMLHQLWHQDPQKPLADGLILHSPALGASGSFKQFMQTVPIFLEHKKLTELILTLDQNLSTLESLERAREELLRRPDFPIASIIVEKDPVVDSKKAADWGDALGIVDPILNRRMKRPSGLGLEMMRAHTMSIADIRTPRDFQFGEKHEKRYSNQSVNDVVEEIAAEIERRILLQPLLTE